MRRFVSFLFKATFVVSAVLIFLCSYIIIEWLQMTTRSMESLAALVAGAPLTGYHLPNGDVAFKVNPLDEQKALIQYFSTYAGSFIVLILCSLRLLQQMKKKRQSNPQNS